MILHVLQVDAQNITASLCTQDTNDHGLILDQPITALKNIERYGNTTNNKFSDHKGEDSLKVGTRMSGTKVDVEEVAHATIHEKGSLAGVATLTDTNCDGIKLGLSPFKEKVCRQKIYLYMCVLISDNLSICIQLIVFFNAYLRF